MESKIHLVFFIYSSVSESMEVYIKNVLNNIIHLKLSIKYTIISFNTKIPINEFHLCFSKTLNAINTINKTGNLNKTILYIIVDEQNYANFNINHTKALLCNIPYQIYYIGLNSKAYTFGQNIGINFIYELNDINLLIDLIGSLNQYYNNSIIYPICEDYLETKLVRPQF